jgi:hypothetical protein
MVKKAGSRKKRTKKTPKKKGGKKKPYKRKTSKKGKTTKIIHQSTKEIRVEKALIENFVALQKVMVNLSSKFDNLSTQISKLLELFEISAKSLAKKDFELEKEVKDDGRIMEKIDNLSQQAGLIGKGLALIHEAGEGGIEEPVPVKEPKPVLKKPSFKPIRPKTPIREPEPPPEFQRLSKPPAIPKIRPQLRMQAKPGPGTPQRKAMTQEAEGPRSMEGYQESIASSEKKNEL